MLKLACSLVCMFIWTGAASLSAEEAAPADGKPLCEIIGAVEAAGYSQVSEVEFDDGAWKIEAYEGGKRQSLRVDPKSAKIESAGEDDDD